ncbi:MAG: hypothetical protein ACLP9S_10315 [Syntrophales bacterium]|jgi:hypothetical protein
MTKTIHHSITCTLSALAVLLVALVAGSAAAESKTYVQEYAYRASKVDGKESSQTIAQREVRKLLLEALAADLGKVTEAGRGQLTKDQIMALAASIVEMEAEDERWHYGTYHIKAQIAAAPGELMKRMDALREDQEKARGKWISALTKMAR